MNCHFGKKGIERRKHPRCLVAATASLHLNGQYLGMFLVDNISVGGAHLIGDAKVKVEDEVTMFLHLPEREPIVLGVEVRQQGQTRDEPMLAVAFKRVSSSANKALDEFVADALEQRPVWTDDLEQTVAS